MPSEGSFSAAPPRAARLARGLVRDPADAFPLSGAFALFAALLALGLAATLAFIPSRARANPVIQSEA